jgi:hypothetical protein
MVLVLFHRPRTAAEPAPQLLASFDRDERHRAQAAEWIADANRIHAELACCQRPHRKEQETP